ncbi:unnamed protein product [Vicia faba]|uniref:WIBG Mago-binding domain-containing protein n=1 Tax=Vicia faba TaxID=3906 RepID=A0AAV0YZ75_VICFA|nr:unnamed protein product [Vicia faba]
MATSDRGEEQLKKLQLNKSPKDGERIIASTRRPDGTLRKEIRIRPGYVPPDEVAIYQPKPALMRKEMASHIGPPPGYDPQLDSKPKTKAVKRNERKKEKKRLQVKETNLESTVVEDSIKQEAVVVENAVHSLTSQINELAVSGDSSVLVTPTINSPEASEPQDLDKRIRALKKKIRLTEALQEKTGEQDLKPEQLEKLAKLEGWRKELKQLENKKTEILVV